MNEFRNAIRRLFCDSVEAEIKVCRYDCEESGGFSLLMERRIYIIKDDVPYEDESQRKYMMRFFNKDGTRSTNFVKAEKDEDMARTIALGEVSKDKERDARFLKGVTDFIKSERTVNRN